ncbi:calcitonin receptor [Hyalella azteca]|uniref:Calcitonin receptor n=1 Tax=Hyalella azteca TaxID=294128 RepID=A0A8B7NJV2_HYAAZ|nr:calcitonin receptor [Hyalella azteca]
MQKAWLLVLLLAAWGASTEPRKIQQEEQLQATSRETLLHEIPEEFSDAEIALEKSKARSVSEKLNIGSHDFFMRTFDEHAGSESENYDGKTIENLDKSLLKQKIDQKTVDEIKKAQANRLERDIDDSSELSPLADMNELLNKIQSTINFNGKVTIPTPHQIEVQNEITASSQADDFTTSPAFQRRETDAGSVRAVKTTEKSTFTSDTHSTKSTRSSESQSTKSTRSSESRSTKSTRSSDLQLEATSVPKTDDIMCRFGIDFGRKLSFSDGTFSRATCCYCYLFISEHRRRYMLRVNRAAHTFLFNNRSMEPFDPSNNVTWPAVRASLIDDLEADKLESCCAEAVNCCSLITQAENVEGSCPATWDGWSCQATAVPSDTLVPVRCPVHAYTGYPECYLYGEKKCEGNGSWFMQGAYEYTNYQGCSMEKFHSMNYYWEIVVNAISLVALSPALLVLLCYKKLHQHRFYMVFNLLLALFLRSLLQILELAIIKIPENLNISTILEDNAAGCKVLVSLRKAALLSVWSWMLAESVFLYRLIARAFQTVRSVKIYVICAWGGAIILTAVWATCRALLENYQCWLGDHKGDPYKLHLITDIPVLLSLLVSVGLLVHMVCILHMQLRGRHDSEQEAKKKVAKATLFLVPVFGVQFLLTSVAPTNVSCVGLQAYLFIAYALTGLQGLLASVLYCFSNRDVKLQLRGTWEQLLSTCCPRFIRDGRRPGDSSVAEPQTNFSTVNSDTDAATGDRPADVMELEPLNRKP